MQPVAGADDLVALLDVLGRLSTESETQRQSIADMCAAADRFSSPNEVVDTAELEAQVREEEQRHAAIMVLLDSALAGVVEATKCLREFSRAEVVRTLDLYHRCSQELYGWQEKRRQAEYELLELHQTEIAVAEKLAAASAALPDP